MGEGWVGCERLALVVVLDGKAEPEVERCHLGLRRGEGADERRSVRKGRQLRAGQQRAVALGGSWQRLQSGVARGRCGEDEAVCQRRGGARAARAAAAISGDGPECVGAA